MRSTLAIQLYTTLLPGEVVRFEKFLDSPYFNHRQDVRDLHAYLRTKTHHDIQSLSKQTVFAAVFPQKTYNNLQMNHLLNFFSERLEQFLAHEEMLNDDFQHRLLRCRAFRKRGLTHHFTRNAAALHRQHQTSARRNAAYWLQNYLLECEIFDQHLKGSREMPENLGRLLHAFHHFITLEGLRWASTVQAFGAISQRESPPMVFTDTAWVFATQSDDPTLQLFREGLEVLRNPEAETAFAHLTELLTHYMDRISPAEARDILMAAINFCIRRHNQGQRQYTRAALDLYKKGLESEILLENGILSRYTYGNINNLAHLLGEAPWARNFLDKYRVHLPADEQAHVYQYNIAIHHFHCSEYAKVLELLRDLRFDEVFVQLDVRKMLVRSYFELGEWAALASLIDSFRAYLRRQKKIGYHRDNYLNFIKFTLRVEKAQRGPKRQRQALSKRIAETRYVAEREWLLGKL